MNPNREMGPIIELRQTFNAALQYVRVLFPSFCPQVILVILLDRGGLFAARQGQIGSLEHSSQAGDVATHQPAGIFIRKPGLPQALVSIVDRAFSHVCTSVKLSRSRDTELESRTGCASRECRKSGTRYCLKTICS